MFVFVLSCLPIVPLGAPGHGSEAAIRPVLLRCESLVEPRGLGEVRPHLSWRLTATDATRRDLVQQSYQVQVATRRERLAADAADLWDSGEVRSAQTHGIEYAGSALASEAEAYWRVRVRDGDGALSAWSETASWSLGLLDEDAWGAAWIGHDAAAERARERPHLRDSHWIAHPEDPGEAPAETRHYRRRFELPAALAIREATLLMTADDRCRVWLNGVALGASEGAMDQRNRPLWARVEAHLVPGLNTLAVAVENDGGPTGLIGRLDVRGSDGAGIAVLTDERWTCARAVTGEAWRERAFDDAAWLPVADRGRYGVAPWGRLPAGDLALPPARQLRRSFAVAKPVQRAVVHASALGLFELRLNGTRVGDSYFDPGWTDYDRRVYARSFDVTTHVRQGENVLGAWLGDGWYAGYVGYRPERHHYGERLRLRARLTVEHPDGTRTVVTTDESWRANDGPIVESDFLMGELYDARLERDGWDAPGFDPADWATVDVTPAIAARVEPHPGPPVRAIATLSPRSITEPEPGVFVLDMGQNLAGFCRLAVAGERGRVITLRFAERLQPDGTLYTENLRAARAMDVYVCRGDRGVEVWQPRFTFHGFQYVEVRGLERAPTPETVTAVALSSDTPDGSTFACSDPMIEQLVSNIRWTQRANFLDVPTDCPQRDERLGWTGDAQIYVHTAALFCDVQAFFRKWLVDLEDAQRADGQFPMVAPLKVAGADGGPGWADAGVICPWAIHEIYGDRRVLERHYDAMVRFLAFCRERSGEDLLPPAEFHCFGDWVAVGANTPKEVIYTAYFAHAADLVARTASVLGRADDAARFRALFQGIKDAFRRAYVADDGEIRGNTQCAYVLALAFDLLDDPELRAAAGRRLVADIEARGGHLSTGFLGTKDLMLVLSKIGRDDVAYRLLHNTSYPSWGFSIRHGATSIWERWNGWTPEKGFMDPGMNSFAHYSFGAVGQWLLEHAAGIQFAAPGYAAIRIAPRPGGTLEWVRATYDAVPGTIASHWRRDGDRFTLAVTIPPNTRAEVHVPAPEGARVTEREGLQPTSRRDGAVVFTVGSGQYEFTTHGP